MKGGIKARTSVHRWCLETSVLHTFASVLIIVFLKKNRVNMFQTHLHLNVNNILQELVDIKSSFCPNVLERGPGIWSVLSYS